MDRVAFVTGASRGIGRAVSLSLAEHGFDCVVAARTVTGSEVHDYAAKDGVLHLAMPGSLQETAELVRERGRRAAVVYMDLLDRSSVEAAALAAPEAFGRIDVLVNNAIYQGPGINDPALPLDLDLLETVYRANVVHQLLLIQRLLPPMLQRKSGSIVNMVSAAGTMDPPVPADQGGWGFAYGSAKAALIRLAGVLDLEHPHAGVGLYTVDPGLIPTEAMKVQGLTDDLVRNFGGAPPEVVGEVIAWLVTDPAASEWHKRLLHAQPLCEKLGLLPGWPGGA
jgi:NAD(P)-dependent dehydrogenase (short-subunit alcohol dehydrogenase family)